MNLKKGVENRSFWKPKFEIFSWLTCSLPGGGGIDRDAPWKIKIKPPRETNVVMAQALTDP